MPETAVCCRTRRFDSCNNSSPEFHPNRLALTVTLQSRAYCHRLPKGIGQLLAAKGDHWAAADTFEALTAIAPNSVKAWTRLALEFQALNRHSDAADAFRKVLELNPGLAPAQYGLGRRLAEPRRTDEATQILSALQDPPTSPSTQYFAPRPECN